MNKEKLEKVKKSIFTNWGLKLVSLLLAMILWFVIVQVDDPTDSVSFSNVHVILTNNDLLDSANKVYKVADGTDTIRVTVRAPKSIVGKLRATDIVAVADVSKLTDINTVSISCSVPNFEVDSVTSNIESVKLEIENRKSKYIKINPDVKGEVEKGFIVSAVNMDQNLVEISGAESIINQVSSGRATIDITDATSSVNANVDIQLYDVNEELLDSSNVSMNVSYVHMGVEVLETKRVLIEADYSGTPAEGYIATGAVNFEPGYVTIAGESKKIASITSIVIPESKVDITGATEDVTVTLNLTDYLPSQIILADSSAKTEKITVSIEPAVERTLTIAKSNVTLTNIPEGVEAELSDTYWMIRLTVSGLEADVNSLYAYTMAPSVDVAAWMEAMGYKEVPDGEYEITPEISLDEGITFVSITPAVIRFGEPKESLTS